MNKFFFHIFLLCASVSTSTLRLSAAAPKLPAHVNAHIYLLKKELSFLQYNGSINYPASLADTVSKAAISADNPQKITLTINPKSSTEYKNFVHATTYRDGICDSQKPLYLMTALATISIGFGHLMTLADGDKFPLAFWLLPGAVAIPFVFSIIYPEILQSRIDTYNKIKDLKQFELDPSQAHFAARHFFVGRGIQPLVPHGWAVEPKNPEDYLHFILHDDQVKCNWPDGIPPQVQGVLGSAQPPAQNPAYKENNQGASDEFPDQVEGQPGQNK